MFRLRSALEQRREQADPDGIAFVFHVEVIGAKQFRTGLTVGTEHGSVDVDKRQE
jgi:hypothetical protein